MGSEDVSVNYDSFPGYDDIYDTGFGPAVMTESVRPGVPRFTVVTALVAKRDHYGSREELVENEDFTMEQVEEALKFKRKEEFTDLRKRLDSSDFSEP